jgi:hypothetical protein
VGSFVATVRVASDSSTISAGDGGSHFRLNPLELRLIELLVCLDEPRVRFSCWVVGGAAAATSTHGRGGAHIAPPNSGFSWAGPGAEDLYDRTRTPTHLENSVEGRASSSLSDTLQGVTQSHDIFRSRIPAGTCKHVRRVVVAEHTLARFDDSLPGVIGCQQADEFDCAAAVPSVGRGFFVSTTSQSAVAAAI